MIEEKVIIQRLNEKVESLEIDLSAFKKLYEQQALDIAERSQTITEQHRIIVQLRTQLLTAREQAVTDFVLFLTNHFRWSLSLNELPDSVSDFLADEPSRIEHDSLCETETYKG